MFVPFEMRVAFEAEINNLIITIMDVSPTATHVPFLLY